MNNYLFLRLIIYLHWIFLILLSGCASTAPTKFYSLSPLVETDIRQETVLVDHGIAIGIGPIEIPDYLDRPHIVTRTSLNELRVSDFDKWAGSLKIDIARVLSENLSALLSTERVYAYPWKSHISIKYQIVVDVTRFDGSPGGDVLLKANWSILGENGKKALLLDSSSLNEQIKGKEYNALVAAESRVLADLSRDIAAAIISILQEVHDK